MPSITIDGPALTDMEKKRILVKEITDAVEKAYGIPREHIMVTIVAHSPDDVATAGVLISDLRKKRE